MELKGRIGHIENVESPFANAGGVAKSIEDVELLAKTGVGWIEAGSYTLEPREGNGSNGERVYYHNAETGETFNSLGMPNKGMDTVEQEIPHMAKIAHAHNKHLVVNVAPVTEDPVHESAELATRAYAAGADAVLLNAGCPNVVTDDGGRHEVLSHNPQMLSRVVRHLGAVMMDQPIFLRLSPYKDEMDMRDALRAIASTKAVSAVFLPNTWGGQRPQDNNGNDMLEVPGGVGGKSGPATANEAFYQTLWATQLLRTRPNIDVVSSGGIMNAHELKRRLNLGAVAGAGTTFFYESENWQADVDKLLTDFADL